MLAVPFDLVHESINLSILLPWSIHISHNLQISIYTMAKYAKSPLQTTILKLKISHGASLR